MEQIKPLGIPPSWLTDWLKVEQDRADRKYSDEMRIYEQNRTSWLENNQHLRELSKDPNNFTPTSYPAIPSRAVWYVVESGMNLDFKLFTDPAITNPVLPPRVQPPPSTPIHTDAPQATDAILAMLRGCVQMLTQILSNQNEAKKP